MLLRLLQQSNITQEEQVLLFLPNTSQLLKEAHWSEALKYGLLVECTTEKRIYSNEISNTWVLYQQYCWKYSATNWRCPKCFALQIVYLYIYTPLYCNKWRLVRALKALQQIVCNWCANSLALSTFGYFKLLPLYFNLSLGYCYIYLVAIAVGFIFRIFGCFTWTFCNFDLIWDLLNNNDY